MKYILGALITFPLYIHTYMYLWAYICVYLYLGYLDSKIRKYYKKQGLDEVKMPDYKRWKHKILYFCIGNQAH